MSSYLSNLLTTTTSRYNSLRRTLLSDETDGDTEDDTHISRVLRAYYTEKGRPFPPWLPPDPRAPQKATSTPFISGTGRAPQQFATGGRGGGLSDLWDTPQRASSAQEPMSLRRGGQARMATPGGGALRQGSDGGGPIVDPYGAGRAGPDLQNQRNASLQSNISRRTGSSDNSYAPTPPPTSSSGTSAQERLKARLLGGSRSSSPTQAAPIASPPYDNRREMYGRAGGSGGGFRGSEEGSRGSSDQRNLGGGGAPPYPDYQGGGRTAYPNPLVGSNDTYASGGGSGRNPLSGGRDGVSGERRMF